MNSRPRFSRLVCLGLCLVMTMGIAPVPISLAAADDSPSRAQMLQALTQDINLPALRLMIHDLSKTFGSRYPNGAKYLAKIDDLAPRLQDIIKGVGNGDAEAIEQAQDLISTVRKAHLENPLIDFDRLLVVRRSTSSPLGLPQNWQDNSSISKTGYDTEIAALSIKTGALSTIFKPDGRFVGDVDLHWNADRMLFSMPDSGGCWQVWETGLDGGNLRQVTPGTDRDVHNFDAGYLPDGRIVFCSTACFEGIPCVGGSDLVSLLYRMDPDGKIRQITFDQDHSWMPEVRFDGKVMYTRWEYSDLPHYFSRVLFACNPDGTEQKAMYGSNSYWPNSLFYAKSIPGSATRFVGIVSGHHGVPRMGDMVVFDTNRGDKEADGAIQRIGHYGEKVDPVIADQLVENNWPKFLHPYPLSNKYFLASVKPNADSPWGVYLVDVFNNMLKLCEAPKDNLFEPIPVHKTKMPPAIPDRVDLKRTDATVWLSDIYSGDAMVGVPRGTVKKLRVYSFHYAYPRMGGHISIGIDGPWDVHRILGTVPVNPDGSVAFKVPANTPIAVQPLDSEGRAIQAMRSWFTAMPGEKLTCVGCHERQKTSPPVARKAAMTSVPKDIDPWYGPARGFSFPREVQPVLNKYCVSCHNGTPANGPDLRYTGKVAGFSSSYRVLHRYVYRPGPESDLHVRKPGEYCADESELVQILKKGHHGVDLDKEAWDRIYTWIDLNVPDHGTWAENANIQGNFDKRRADLLKQYAYVETNPEAVGSAADLGAPAVPIKPAPRQVSVVNLPGWPLDETAAKQLQTQAGKQVSRTVAIKSNDGKDVPIEMVLIPAGKFIMGSDSGSDDESPRCVVSVNKPFWMSKCEITNRQFQAFDPKHESGFFNRMGKDQSDRGLSLNGTDQPVVRVSWDQAMGFCRWLASQSGVKFALPTEIQWEYACRAGSGSDFFFGSEKFGQYANLADENLARLAGGQAPAWRPADSSVNDGAVQTSRTGAYKPNTWGLCDMIGNAAEWTLTEMRPYPSEWVDIPFDPTPYGNKVVRGGSFYDRPYRATASFRLAYLNWRAMPMVGFRVVCPAE